jgi:hypothetical protein
MALMMPVSLPHQQALEDADWHMPCICFWGRMAVKGRHRCLRKRQFGLLRRKRTRIWQPRRSTLLDLVQQLLRESDSEVYVVDRATRLINSGRVILIGSFRGARINH